MLKFLISWEIFGGDIGDGIIKIGLVDWSMGRSFFMFIWGDCESFWMFVNVLDYEGS